MEVTTRISTRIVCRPYDDTNLTIFSQEHSFQSFITQFDDSGQDSELFPFP